MRSPTRKASTIAAWSHLKSNVLCLARGVIFLPASIWSTEKGLWCRRRGHHLSSSAWTVTRFPNVITGDSADNPPTVCGIPQRSRNSIEVGSQVGENMPPSVIRSFTLRSALAMRVIAERLRAWRERPQPWPRARSQTRSDLVVAHATFLRLSASSPPPRPRAAKSAARSVSSTTSTRYFSYSVIWRVNATTSSRVGQTKHGTSRGNTSRGRAFPLRFP